jgi:hypothetical protein
MTKQLAAGIAFFVVQFVTPLWTRKLGRGDSTEPGHVALQTRQDIGSIFGALCITNGLLAAILVALLF